MDRIEKYWQDFLQTNNVPAEVTLADAFCFGNNEEMATTLLELVLSGKKTATCSSILSYTANDELPPKKGDYLAVTDWKGIPKCIIKITDIKVIRFCDMTFDICRLEGEDETLESWRENHKKFFTEDAKENKYKFTEEMKLIFEEFEVVYK